LSERIKLTFDDQRALQQILGSPPEDKRVTSEIERAAGVAVHVRGGEVMLEGGDNGELELVERLLGEMYELARSGRPIPRADVTRALEVLRGDPTARLGAVYEDHVLAKTASGRGIAPRSLAQKLYVDTMRRHALTFAIGPAGTGKTYLAVAMAVRRLLDKQVRRIILTRPAIEAGESLGFLPGSFEEKVSPYMRPLYDGLYDMLDGGKVNKLVETGVIEIAPLAYMRGRTLSDAFVILDEAQNTTSAQMKMFLTRLGLGTWAVVTGDPSQVDLPGRQRSGLADALGVLRGVRSIAQCRLDSRDVMRHQLVQDIVKAYDDRTSRDARADKRRHERNGAPATRPPAPEPSSEGGPDGEPDA
jgi:phosphate starvation-inducible PhoH-like protein